MARAPVSTAEAAADGFWDLVLTQVQLELDLELSFAEADTEHERVVWGLINDFIAGRSEGTDEPPPLECVPEADGVEAVVVD